MTHLSFYVKVVIWFGMIAALTTPSWAQSRQLTIDEIFDPSQRIDFDGDTPRNLVWLDNYHYLQRDQENKHLIKVNVMTGTREIFLDLALFEIALAGLPNITAIEAERVARRSDHIMNTLHTAFVFDFDNDIYLYNFSNHKVRRLTNSSEREEEVSFSPNGQLIAFVRNHNLLVIEVANNHEYALTANGDALTLNGQLDWVYQEEIYGRGNFRGYWWSPDSNWIAYLQLDDSEVQNFTIVDHISYHQDVEVWKYPKAGDPNPRVSLGVVGSTGGETSWIDIENYEPSSPLIVSVSWSPDSRNLIFQIQNREQTWLDLSSVNLKLGTTKHILRETTKAWVNVNGPPLWIDDESFLWMSERSGWKHIYYYDKNGNLIHQITDGAFEVRQLHGFDSNTGWIYWSGTKRSYIGSDIYKVQLDGSVLTRISNAEGTHRAQFNSGFTFYIDTWSTITTPPQIRAHMSDGSEIHVIDDNQVSVLNHYQLSMPEFLQVQNRDGFSMEAMMIKPPEFDPKKSYPVYQHVYGGPHIQSVRNAWRGSTYLFWQLLAQHGVIVWVMDNSTASGKGAVSTWPVYKNFGELELRDIEDGISWLSEQPFIDTTKIGLEGWSYGGYMVSYALTHSKKFAMGIAGGSVTDWRDYDTIYTERYMQTPQNNPDGYRNSSPRFLARELQGELLLIHGSMDENVHMQNTLQFAYELQKSGKSFDLMIYPKSRHRLGDADLEKHRHVLMLKFVLEHLRTNVTETDVTQN